MEILIAIAVTIILSIIYNNRSYLTIKVPIFYVFKVGDRIQNRHTLKVSTIIEVNEGRYVLYDGKEDLWSGVDLLKHWIVCGKYTTWLGIADIWLTKILRFLGISIINRYSNKKI